MANTNRDLHKRQSFEQFMTRVYTVPSADMAHDSKYHNQQEPEQNQQRYVQEHHDNINTQEATEPVQIVVTEPTPTDTPAPEPHMDLLAPYESREVDPTRLTPPPATYGITPENEPVFSNSATAQPQPRQSYASAGATSAVGSVPSTEPSMFPISPLDYYSTPPIDKLFFHLDNVRVELNAVLRQIHQQPDFPNMEINAWKQHLAMRLLHEVAPQLAGLSAWIGDDLGWSVRHGGRSPGL
ncbi:hypothetical protein M8818_003152 [Zalaria obscura]|uniref:Uncharacterized protein n=1 Tax=Zalaria obscura TaxID=2024903 RepID=A0ACC3SF75_9PEZI